jgi:multiple sugar transport system permease protein/cellobiose transport system permease protein
MGYIFILPFFVVFIVFNMYPILYSLWLSFFDWNGIGTRAFTGAANYVRLISADPYFFKSIANTLIVLIGYLPATIILSLLIATLLNNKRIKHASYFQTAQFLPYIIAPVCVGMLFMLLFDWSSGMVNQLLLKLGIIDEGLNWLGEPFKARFVLILLNVWKELGYVITLFLAGMTNIPSELIEAAEVDGANYFQKLTRIIVPQLKPIILFVVITGTIGCLQMFDSPKTLFNPGEVKRAIGGPMRSCLTAVWYMIDTAFGQSTGMPSLGYGAAISYGLFIITLIFSSANYLFIKRTGGSNE